MTDDAPARSPGSPAQSEQGGNGLELFVEDPEYVAWLNREVLGRAIDEPVVQYIDGGIIMPYRPAASPKFNWAGGVVTADGSFVAGHRRTADSSNAEDIAECYPLPASVRRVHETVIWGGGGGRSFTRDHFGHILTEGISRLWFWAQQCEPGARIALPDERDSYSDLFMGVLGLMGITSQDLAFHDEPVQYDRVIVPRQSLVQLSGAADVGRLRIVYDAMCERAPEAPARKVYLSRSQQSATAVRGVPKRELNEHRIEEFYRAQGFEVVVPETLDLNEQIAILAHAEEVASLDGTLAHLVALCRAAKRQTVIMRSPRGIPLVQFPLMATRSSTRCALVSSTMPLLSNARVGAIIYFTSTQEWARYAQQWFGVYQPSTPPAEDVVDYLTQWTRLLRDTPPDLLNRLDVFTPAEIADWFSRTVMQEPLTPDTRARLRRAFATRSGPVDKTLTKQVEAMSRDAERLQAQLEKARSELERAQQRNEALKGSWTWRLGRLVTAPARPLEQMMRRRR